MMHQQNEPLISTDGEILIGFHEVGEMLPNWIEGAIVPIMRCKRCGCWLRAPQGEEVREYCSPCEVYLRRQMRVYAFCGDEFFSEEMETTRCPECEEEYQANKQTCRICGAEFLPYVCIACKDKPRYDTVCHACHWKSAHVETAAMRNIPAGSVAAGFFHAGALYQRAT